MIREDEDCRPRIDPFLQNTTQLRFHQIKDREIVQVTRPTYHRHETLIPPLRLTFCVVYEQGQHLGRGTRTNIYAGSLLVRGGDSVEDDEFNNNSSANNRIPVILKILDQSQKDFALVRHAIFALLFKRGISGRLLVHYLFFLS